MSSNLPLLYLACPYSDGNEEVKRERLRISCEVAAVLMAHGIAVFNPLSHTVGIAEAGDLPEDHDFWMRMDLPILSRCDEMLVLALDGWMDSRGVQTEIEFAIARGIPVTIIEPADINRLPEIRESAHQYLHDGTESQFFPRSVTWQKNWM